MKGRSKNVGVKFGSILLGLCLWLLAVVKVAGQGSGVSADIPFNPATDVYINCGGSANASVDGVGLFLLDSNSVFVTDGILATNSVPSNDGSDPYPSLLETARLFLTESVYKIPVSSSGRVWLRMWFYPITYSQSQQTYHPSNALFSVSANGFNLLTNLTAAEMTAGGSSFLYVEYLINVTTGSLLVTFMPLPNAFAFVNGLAVVSIPDNMLNDGVSLVPPGQVKMSMAGNALETMYRLNVGGDVVTPSNDSYLTRMWGNDALYVLGAVKGANFPTIPSNKIIYPNGVPTWIAPGSVYGSGRGLGIGSSSGVNTLANLTWSFTVDPGYAYYVRLHFAEIVYTAVSQRVFNVFLNNQTALVNYDCVQAAGDRPDAASFRDFIVPMSDGTTDRLWLAMGPASESSQYPDVILNGLEIFKLNNSIGSLAGTVISQPVLQTPSGRKTNGMNIGTIVGAAVGGLAAVGVLVAGICFFCSHKSKGIPKHPSPTWLPLPLHHGGNSESRTASKISTISHKSGTGSYVSSAASNLGRYFTFSELQEATNNFDEDLLLGVGGFGKVYKAEIDDGMLVAVKRGNPRSEQGLTEFQTEIELLSKLRHRHLVSLIGYCEENCEMILVYDYMANGPLRGHLYGTELPCLSWKQRLEICVGAARGLHYLHTGAAHGIIHRDVKTTNILLDDNFVAKVADFGLSKTGPSLDRTHVSTAVKGSFGYLDPEYFRRQQLTEKSDVYSFGVVLMEVVCARPAINPALPREQVNIAEWAMQWQRLGMLDSIIDPKLIGYVNPESLRKFGETAEKCLAEQGVDRPAMGDVLWNLEYALQLQENSMENSIMEGSINRILEMPASAASAAESETEEPDLTITNNSLGSDDVEDATASAVFSQMVNTQGR